MSARRTRGLVGLAAGIAVTTASFGFAFAATQPSGDGAMPLTDGNGTAHQHGDSKGHLPPTQSKNIELVGKTALKNVVPEKIADVGVLGDYAYLAAWGVQTCKYNGIHVVDISDLKNPREVAFIRAKEGSYPGEGIHPISISTPAFTGDIVVSNNERCNTTTGFGGLNIYDVTDPTSPTPLAEGIGDFTVNGQGKKAANEIHSVFAWDAGDRAYVMMTDNEEGRDVDIMDITNPRQPFLAAEYDLDEIFPQIAQATPENLKEVFLHDMVVKQIDGRQVALLSYWDAGYVMVDVTDVKNPVYLGDTDYATIDPEAAESRFRVAPEGNGHQGEFTRDNKYFVGTDEDFSPLALTSTNDTDGTKLTASQGSDTTQLEIGSTISGQAKFAGRACNGDAAVPSGDGTQIAVVERGVCTFSEKVANVARAGGYQAILIFNREGSDACEVPLGMSVEGSVPTFGVTPRSEGYAIFGATYDEAACKAGDGTRTAPMTIGQTGDKLTFSSYFDGWGYVHLFANKNGKQTSLDTYAVPEAHDPAYAEGFGDLSVHEVATSLQRDNLLYFAYYSAGFRVAAIEKGQIVEKGRYIADGGSNFWGVEAFVKDGVEYVATSDRDYGLWIFKYNG
ncbi:MAG TPA: PA domain-containing protein [Nocardioides sp.]|nr:PA domain-containing protein [Nocardioides sp.]